MTKLELAVSKSEKDQFLSWLQDEEIVHLAPVSQKTDEAQKTDTAYELSRLQFALQFLQEVREQTGKKEKRSWKNMFAQKPIATLEELNKAVAETEYNEIIAKLHQRHEELNEVQAKRRELQEKISLREPWKTLVRTETEETSGVSLLVEVAFGRWEALQKKLQKAQNNAFQEISRKVVKNRGQVFVEVVTLKSEEKNVRNILTEAGAKIFDFENSEKSFAEQINSQKQQLADLEKTEEKILEETSAVLQQEEQLKKIYDALLHKQEQENINKFSVTTNFAFVIAGWVPTNSLAKFTARLEKKFPNAAWQKIMPHKEEQAPVLFQNKKIMQPFEAVTDIYGKPRYNELDPSPILSLFFLIAFGIALTDAGYGIVMMLGTGLSLKFLKLKKNMAKMFKLLFLAGLFTFVIGALTGGWFGLTLEELPQNALTSLLLTIKLTDPIQQPMILLGVAFGLGILQLLVAWGVKAYDLWRNGQKSAALMDGVAWITMVVFLLAWAGTKLGVVPGQFERLAYSLLLTNTLILVLTQGRQHKNILLRLGSGVMSLYGLISFMSDVLSYSRLLALGLATAIIGLVVNLISGMVINMIPVVGIVIAVVILIGGHLFNLGINALGAFIHSGRLQFVEFFPKFIEGGGVAYKPFGRVSKYVDNPNDF